MELLNISLDKLALVCPSCFQSARFYIYPKKRQIKTECVDGHKYKNISFYSFNKFCVKALWSSNKECKQCYTKINEFKDNYICKICGYIFCPLCIDTHIKNSNHNNKIKYINYNSICHIHNNKYKYYCKTCNSNLCNKCRKMHMRHDVKAYKKLIQFIKSEINYFDTTVEDNRRKIKYARKRINYHSLDGHHRKIYLKILNIINEYFLYNFNFEFFNYYHYKNLEYFYKFVNKQINSINFVEISNEYIPFLRFKFNKLQKKEIKNVICNCYENQINYDKNLLFIFSSTPDYYYLKLFEIKNYCLRLILAKKFGETDISLYRPMKKDHKYIFVFDNIIKIFQYDENKETLSLKDQIKNDVYITGILDLKNGDIIITTYSYLKIIKEKKTFKIITGQYSNLNEINDNIMLTSGNNEITLFDTDKYQIIKKIHIFSNAKIKNIIIHDDKYIIAVTESNEFTYVIDIKNLEIIQKIENEENLKDFHYISYNKNIYIASDKQIKKYKKYKTGYCGKMDETEKYYTKFDLTRFKADKNHLFLIGNKEISEIDFL